MYGLIRCLYDEEKQKVLETLYSDSDSSTQLLIRSTIAEALKDTPKIIESNGTDFILCTLCSYHKSEKDTARIFQSIMNMFDKMSFGILTEDIQWKPPEEIADSCLVGLSFFRKHMEELHQRRAAPSPDYYKQAGSVAFETTGYETISKDFDGWTNFIEKELTIISMS